MTTISRASASAPVVTGPSLPSRDDARDRMLLALAEAVRFALPNVGLAFACAVGGEGLFPPTYRMLDVRRHDAELRTASSALAAHLPPVKD